MSDQSPAPRGSTEPDDDGLGHTAGPPDPRWRPDRTKIIVAIVLLVAVVAPLLVPTYSRIEPRLLGFPFFYWYQLLWVFLCAAACGISFLLIRDKHRSDR